MTDLVEFQVQTKKATKWNLNSGKCRQGESELSFFWNAQGKL